MMRSTEEVPSKAELGELKTMLSQMAPTGLRASAGGMWTWVCAVGDEEVSKSMQLIGGTGEKTARSHLAKAFTANERAIVRSMYDVYLLQKKTEAAAVKGAPELREYVARQARIIWRKMTAPEFLALMHMIAVATTRIHAMGMDVEGPANRPVFLQVAYVLDGVYYAILVVFSNNDNLEEFIATFNDMKRGIAVVVWGAQPNELESRLSTVDMQDPGNKVHIATAAFPST